jgi:hypothetical protein
VRHAILLGLLATAACLAAGDAVAQSAPPPDPGVGQIAQYIEVIPTAQGGVPTSTRKKGRKARESANLSSKARRKVETAGGADADVLTEITSMSPSPATSQSKPKSRPTPMPAANPGTRVELLDGVRIAVSATSGRGHLVAIGVLVVLLTSVLILASRTRVRAASRL